MKTQKAELLDFKQNELNSENKMNIKSGTPINPPKPGSTASGTGSGETRGEITCWFNFDNEVIICINNTTGEIVGGFAE